MKLALFVVLALVVAIGANPLSRHCKCKAVSNTIHFTFHRWDISSCKFCSCKDASVIGCQEACKSAVENYAKLGCGKTPKGSKVKYSWDAGSCSSGTSQEEYTCA